MYFSVVKHICLKDTITFICFSPEYLICSLYVKSTVTVPLVRILTDNFKAFNGIHGGTTNGKCDLLDRFKDVSDNSCKSLTFAICLLYSFATTERY